MHDLIAARWRDDPATLGRAFAQARPFRHLVLDDFLAADFAQALLAGFPGFDVRYAIDENGTVGGKAVVEKLRGVGPAYARLDDLVQSGDFLRWLSAATGIPDLEYDPHYFGGGTHENRHGQDLDPHIDFNRHPVTGTHRRLNLIVYLNPGWERAWGGSLELHTDPYAADDEVTLVDPVFNRCVVFETTESSWHGFRRIDLPPDRRESTSRKSIAFYFYTKERPPEETAPTHSTVYVDRPLPERFQAGMTLTEHDVAELRNLVSRQSSHTRRLYRDLTRVQAELEQASAALRGGRLGRVVYFARRALARLRR